jgi:hypothetical protein
MEGSYGVSFPGAELAQDSAKVPKKLGKLKCGQPVPFATDPNSLKRLTKALLLILE